MSILNDALTKRPLCGYDPCKKKIVSMIHKSRHTKKVYCCPSHRTLDNQQRADAERAKNAVPYRVDAYIFISQILKPMNEGDRIHDSSN